MKYAGIFIILIIFFITIFFRQPLIKIFSQISTISVTVPGDPPIVNFFAYPQNRGTRTLSTNGIFEVRSRGTTQVLQTYSSIITDNTGYYPLLTLENLYGGTYDLVYKGYSHIKRKVSAISLISGDANDDVNFGTLFAGDVKTTAESPNGDNAINGLDMSTLNSVWDSNTGDTGPSENRSDLNEDNSINGLDMSLLVNNWNSGLVGD